MFQETLPTAIICYYSLPGLDRENTGNKLPNLYKLYKRRVIIHKRM